MNRTRNYVAALYCRLSKDDGTNSESMSISSQKAILKQYANSNKIAIYDYYVDDGYSGTNFERPAFKQMIKDIENKKINCVITKDLSRLGRNYLQSGTYIEMYFPNNNVRYIAITDGIDTLKINDMDIMPFKNILNEMYAKDNSKKVKAALKSRMQDGRYIGSKAPFGYKKDPNDKHKLIIDEETRYIVELIYKLCLDGLGTQLICKEMMKRKIPRPSAFTKNAEKLYGLTEDNKYKWTHRMALSILRDSVYCGDMARNKRPTMSYKNDKRLYVPRTDYIVKENTHEGIIDKESWQLVQTMLDKRRNKNIRGIKYDNIFKGLVKCPTCNYAITPNSAHRRTRPDPIDCVVYNCSTYKKQGTDGCSMHKIEARDLHNIVLADIQYHGAMAMTNRQDLVDKIVQKVDREQLDKEKETQEKIKDDRHKLEELDKAFEKLYEDRLNEIILERNFKMMSDKLSKKQKDLIKEIERLERLAREEKENKENCEKFISNLSKFAKIKELSRYILNQVIDVIYVYDQIENDGEITQKVEIHYKFIGTLE